MTQRATEALAAGRDDMARQAAESIASMENEARLRQDTVDRLETQVTRLRGSVEAAHRRLIDLKQGAITARAIRREQQMQGALRTTIANYSHPQDGILVKFDVRRCKATGMFRRNQVRVDTRWEDSC